MLIIIKTFFGEISLRLTKQNKLMAAGRKLSKQQLLFSALMTFFCILITYFFWGYIFAKSALLGGLVAIIPQFVFALRAFKYAGATKAQLVVDTFYKGEKLKLLISVILFALTFKFFIIVPITFFTVFCLVLIMSLLTPIFMKH
ncbi:MAG: ATP synthase subunit I [Alteromonadaceae bacterium]|nr:ATP synthase subunit I [Alteromonadaceae bacterium]MBL4908885.1 ATP synthase subunit I [Alteromonadaceae bacterium]